VSSDRVSPTGHLELLVTWVEARSPAADAAEIEATFHRLAERVLRGTS
jgi:hypothetical protein